MTKQWNILSEKIPRKPNENITDYILRLRNVQDYEHFLNPVESDLLPLNNLKNIDKAASIILEGFKNNKRFTVFYDCDMDGVSSGTIIYRALKEYTKNISWIINKGKIHGLELQSPANIIDTTDILICCDSSSNDFKEHKYLSEHGVQVVVLDHHESEESQFATVVNSQFGGYQNPHLSGSGLCWKFVKYLDFLTGQEYAEDLVDLACVGIISDVSDISENSYENRYICFKGFENLINPALKAIVGNYQFNGQSCGWSIAPIVNAAMRSNNNELAVELFLSDKIKDCKQIIKQIKEIKQEEDQNKKDSVNNLIFQIKNSDQENKKVIGVFTEDKEHTGVIGNVLSDMYKRPVIVLHDKEDDELYKGSIRGFGIRSFRGLIQKIGLAEKCEGHPNSAGLEVRKDKYDELLRRLNNALKDVEFELVEDVDVILTSKDITTQLVKDLSRINTVTGKNFSPVVIAIESCEITNLQQMKPDHLKWDSQGLEFFYWKSADKIKDFENSPGTYRICDVLGGVQIGSFRGISSKQFIVSDYRNSREELDFLRGD